MLKDDFVIDEHISTICLPDPEDPEFASEDCFVTGFGSKEPMGKNEDIMKRIKLNLVNFNECQTQYKAKLGNEWFRLHRYVTCAGGEKDAFVDVCNNDRGSPLICPDKNNENYYQVKNYKSQLCYSETCYNSKSYQAGIVNTGIGCGNEGVPTLYTNVTMNVYFIEWATKCHFEETRIYPLNKYKGDKWAKDQFCKIGKTISHLEEKVCTQPLTINS